MLEPFLVPLQEKTNLAAIDHYRETLKLKPDLVAVQKNLETALLRSGKHDRLNTPSIP